MDKELGNLIEPPSVPFQFSAPGWYVLAVLCILLVGSLAWLIIYYRKRNAYRKRALCLLSEEEVAASKNGSYASLIYKANSLMKRIAMSKYGRVQTAGVSGTEWTKLLNTTGRENLFDVNDAGLLSEMLYNSDKTISSDEADAFVNKTKRWIKKHAHAL